MAQESWNREKEETGCQVPEGLKLCVNNCGFFGSPATMNLCSNCYNELLRLNTSIPSIVQQQPGVSIPRPGVSGAPEFRSEDRPCLEVVGGLSVAGSAQPETPQRQMNRCTACRKRVGLTGFKCRCGDLFCAFHRYSDKHNCNFDYKAAGRVAIAKANPVVKADKIQRF